MLCLSVTTVNSHWTDVIARQYNNLTSYISDCDKYMNDTSLYYHHKYVAKKTEYTTIDKVKNAYDRAKNYIVGSRLGQLATKKPKQFFVAVAVISAAGIRLHIYNGNKYAKDKPRKV